jgi:hypothetical protein
MIRSRMDPRLKTILNDALDSALKEHVANLFTVWMRDATDQPNRAIVGANKAIAAWRQAIQAIETMED